MEQSPRRPAVRSVVSADRPAVIVSLPCPRCEGEDPACAHCRGEGIELWRVPPEEAALEPDELRARHGPGPI